MCRQTETSDKQELLSADVRPSTKAKLLKKQTLNYVDYEQKRREHVFAFPKFLEDWVVESLLRRKDVRNLGIFYVGVNILMTSLPAAMMLYYVEQNDLLSAGQQVALGAVYTLVHMKFWGRSFMLALHYLSHCSIFNLQFRFLDHIMKAGICVMFGIPPALYYPHHVGMHHGEDNVAPRDMSSTMDYDRSSKWNHFKYMFRFWSIGNFELPFRLFQMKKYDLAIQSLLGSISFAIILISAYNYSPIASMFTLWVPWVAISFGLMQGNFKEHIFVDPKDFGNNYKTAMSCINCPSNALTFNTGYHIEHHEEPGLPWFQLPDLFLKNLDKHAKNDSLIFDGIGPMEVGTFVLNGKFDQLADYYLNVGQPKRTREELIAEFKRRLTPVDLSKLGKE